MMKCKKLIITIIFVFPNLLYAEPNLQSPPYIAGKLYEEGKEARLSQQFKLAQEKLEAARKIDPKNSDVHVQLGFTYYTLGQLDLAKQSFGQALVIAPNYVDAMYGLVRVALAEGKIDDAETMLNGYLQDYPNDEQLLTVQKEIQAIKDAIHYWRLDASGSYSRLSSPYDNWKEMDFALSYRLTKDTSIAGHFLQANRFDMNDQRIGSTIWHTFNDRAYGYVSGFASLSQNFLASYTIATGGDWAALMPYNEDIGSFHLALDLKLDHYKDGNVKSITPGFEQFFLGDRLSIAAKWFNTFDQNNKHVNGYLAKIAGSPTDKLHLFAGYADALETSNRSGETLVKVKTFFTGLTYDIYDTFSINVNYADEDREQQYKNINRHAYTRKTIGTGFTWIF